MNKQKLTLLMGLTTASVLAGGILAPAQAALVHYSVAGAFNDGSAIKGNFDYDGTTYSNATIKTFAQTSGVGTFTAKTYTIPPTAAGSSPTTLTLQSGVPLAPFSQLSLTFGSLATLPLTSSLNGANELQLVFSPTFTSNTRTVTSGSITAVPFEAPALPVMGSTLLFGLGIWAKNKKAKAKQLDLSA